MGAHPLITGLLGIHEGDGLGGTSLGAGRVAAAQITLVDHAAVDIVIHCAEGTGDGAHLAADTGIGQYLFHAGGFIQHNGFHRTGVETPGLATLGAGVGGKTPAIMKVEYLDPGFGRVEHPLLLERARQFTLQATGAFFRFQLQGFEHCHSPPIADICMV